MTGLEWKQLGLPESQRRAINKLLKWKDRSMWVPTHIEVKIVVLVSIVCKIFPPW